LAGKKGRCLKFIIFVFGCLTENMIVFFWKICKKENYKQDCWLLTATSFCDGVFSANSKNCRKQQVFWRLL